MSKKSLENFSVTIGLISGVALGLAVLFIWVIRIDLNPPQPISTASPTATSDILYFDPNTTPSPPVVTETSEPFKSSFATAEAAISENDYATAHALLMSLSAQALDENDQARVFGDLGDSENMQGHYALACNDYFNQFKHNNSPAVLNTLAETCLAAGYLREALTDYQNLANWPTSDGDPYRADAKSALASIQQMLGTPEPTSSSSQS